MAAAMSAKQYRRALEDFQLTQGYAGLLFGGKSSASGRRWPAEGAPYHVALIISIMREYGLDVEDIEMLATRWRRKRKKGD